MAKVKQTKYVYLQGKCKYCKVQQPDTQYNCWNTVLYPTEESYQLILKLKEGFPEENIEGIKNDIKKDEDGYYLNIKRPCTIKVRGDMVALAPPDVLDGRNLGPDGFPLPFREFIGNGSDITVKCEVYYYSSPMKKKGSALRMKSVRVDNLVPYETTRDYDEAQMHVVANLDKQPQQLF